ncbi:MBL fold metallo-hydrolase [Amedibacillus dolichus]|uniref:MBL fold metallo-hydrolase n=1 Tax=Amedibacillus dolichus TaxID=31971 RepID=UPI00217511E1|nr:MBL fold metallo-hydrolase [Amedibacillus dolichus]
MKKIDVFVLGMVQVNTYVLWNDNHVLIVDPGTANAQLMQKIEEAGAIVDGIVLLMVILIISAVLISWWSVIIVHCISMQTIKQC